MLYTGVEASARDYSIPGTNISKIFTTIGASANLVFAFNTGMLPEIQVSKRYLNFLHDRLTCHYVSGS